MNEPVSPLTLTLSDWIMHTAEPFGVTAHVYVHEHRRCGYGWKNGALRRIGTKSGWHMTITVITPDGKVGQATTDEPSADAVFSCFHQARTGAGKRPGLITSLARMQQLESRFPPLLAASNENADKPVWNVTPILSQIEAHHRHMRATYDLPAFSTELTLSQESYSITRSDGATHRSRLCRGHVRDQWMHPDEYTAHSCETGSTASRLQECSVDSWVSSLDEQLADWHREQLLRSKDPVSLPAPPVSRLQWDKQDLQLLVDADITACLTGAWLCTPADLPLPNNTAARLQINAVEGALSYQPVHPYGYLLVPTALVPDSEDESAGLHLLRDGWRLDESFASHLTLELPELGWDGLPFQPTPVSGREQQREQAWRQLMSRGLVYEEDFYLLEGVRRFHLDPASGRFGLLPKRLYRIENDFLVPVKTIWLGGSIERLLPAFIGGLSGLSGVADTPPAKSLIRPLSPAHPRLTNWTLSAPSYAYLHFAGPQGR